MKFLFAASSLAIVLCLLSHKTLDAQSGAGHSDYLDGCLHSPCDSVQTAWVNHYASGHAPATGEKKAMVVDDSGNIYVTGNSHRPPFGVDYLTMKYSPSGVLLWAVKYDGEINGDDYATAICVDDYGNVFVTGRSEGSETKDDYATVKYDTNGNQQWVARYNGPVNKSDKAEAIGVDKTGYVYVTGKSQDTTNWNDYATVKYNPEGVQEWVVRYNGPNNSDDAATGLAVDDSGHAYVTGYSWGIGTGEDYTTIKYDSEGTVQWISRYDGPEHYHDTAQAFVVDTHGNVYVTGDSYLYATETDYVTVKYNSEGIEEWVARYDGPRNLEDRARAIIIDDSNNVYVTGWSDGFGSRFDYTTIKYDSVGALMWIARYDGSANEYDGAYALAVDQIGNVYVTGWSEGSGTGFDYATVKYNPNGIQEWVIRYDGPGHYRDGAFAIALDSFGNIYVSGISGADHATIQYNSTGIQEWIARYNGAGNSFGRASDIAVDDEGDVYVTGSSEASGRGSDYATVKYTSEGTELWAAHYNGPASGEDFPIAIAVDNQGNIYVTGGSDRGQENYDFATIKYNSNGIEQWMNRYSGPGDSWDVAAALALDNLGNVYVTGYSGGLESYNDYATVKYNSQGIMEWVARYDGPRNGYDESTALAVDESGNVYVTGASVGSGTAYDYATVKYNSDGIEQWVARYNGPGNVYDGANAIAVDASGNVYVTGESWDSETADDFATIKYDSEGIEQWVARYDAGGNHDEGNGIVVDGEGNVYVTGTVKWSNSNSDYATIKYNSVGEKQWVVLYDGPGGGYDVAEDIEIDGLGNIYVTGGSRGTGRDSDCATIKYNSDGTQLWITRFNGLKSSSDKATALALDRLGNIYVTGRSEGDHWCIYTTIKYVQSPVSISEDEGIFRPPKYRIFQNHPNPFNSTTEIRYQIPDSRSSLPTTLKIFNIMGQKLKTLVNEVQEAGYYSVTWDGRDMCGDEVSSGVYFYRLDGDGFSETRKLILLK